jgi:prevent-host-death family protein
MATRQISPLVLRQRLAEIVEEVRDEGNAVIVEAAGHVPAAVLLGIEQYKSLLRTAASLARPGSPEAATFSDLLRQAENPQKPG